MQPTTTPGSGGNHVSDIAAAIVLTAEEDSRRIHCTSGRLMCSACAKRDTVNHSLFWRAPNPRRCSIERIDAGERRRIFAVSRIGT